MLFPERGGNKQKQNKKAFYHSAFLAKGPLMRQFTKFHGETELR